MKKLYTHKILLLSAISVLLMAAGTALSSSSGAPASYTDAPGEDNCTTSGCHSGTLNPTSANLANLTLGTTFTGGGYIPDSTYTLTLTYTQSGINRFGMEITCLTKTGNSPAGTFTAGTGSQKTTGSVFGKTREYLTHTSSSSSGSRTWVFTWKAPSTNVDSIIFYVVVNAANSDGSTSGDQIYAKQFKFAPSSLLPVATINANKTTICAGDTIKFGGSGTNNPTSYAWKFRGTPTTSTLQNVDVIYNTPGTFTDTLRVFNAKGSSVPAVVTIKVNAKPNAFIISTQPNDTVCEGDSITLTAGFGTGYKYQWNTGNAADTNQTVKIGKSGSYRVTTSVAGGCSSTSNAVNLVIKTRPAIILTSTAVNDETCANDSVEFTATAGNDNYIFSRNGNVVQTGVSATYKTLLAPGDIISAVAEKDGCESLEETKAINVITPGAAPVVSCGTSTTSSVTFNWAAVTGATGYEVSEDNGQNWITPSSGATGLSHTKGGLGFSTQVQLKVRALDNSLCGKTLEAAATCSTLSCSGVTYTTTVADTIVCPGDSTTITISNISSPNFGIKFGTGSFTTDTVYWVVPTQTTQYPFEIIDSNTLNCGAAPFNVEVKFDNVPALTATVAPGNTVCQGTPISISSSTGFDLYSLYRNGNPVFPPNALGVFNNITVANGDAIKIMGLRPSLCTTFSNETIFTINPLPKPGFTASVNNKVVNFDDTTSTTASRVWNFGDNSAVETQKTPSHTYATVGTFDVKLIVTDNNQCVDSVTQQVTTANVSAGEIEGLQSLAVYPNPTTGQLLLQMEWNGNQPVKIIVTDIAGKKVMEDIVNGNGKMKHELNLQHLPGGTYLLHLQTENGEKTLKILKQDK